MLGRRLLGLQAALLLASLPGLSMGAELASRRRCRPGCDFAADTDEEFAAHVREAHSSPAEAPGEIPLLSREEVGLDAGQGFGGEHLPAFVSPKPEPLTEANLHKRVAEMFPNGFPDRPPARLPVFSDPDPELARVYASMREPIRPSRPEPRRPVECRADPGRKKLRKAQKAARRAGRRK